MAETGEMTEQRMDRTGIISTQQGQISLENPSLGLNEKSQLSFIELLEETIDIQ